MNASISTNLPAGPTALLDLELRVPDPHALTSFWTQLGMVATDDGVLGTADRPVQLRLAEGPYRHVSELTFGCADPADLTAIGARLERLGIAVDRSDEVLRFTDPVLDHRVVVRVGEAPVIEGSAADEANRPGDPQRVDRRAAACTGDVPTAPRRLGHVVFGSPDVEASRAVYVDGLGLRVSDGVGGGLAWFLRCGTDHHTMLLSPAPVPCLNHYALELDDIDAIGLTAMRVLQERPEAGVAGPGRHVVGANLFWYLLDPAGGMFELFADMDQITDDESWERDHRRDDWDPFTVGAWMPGAPAPDFWLPADLDELGRARDAAGR